MRRSMLPVLCPGLLLAVSAAAQPPAQLLDILKVKVRPDKGQAYEAAIKRLVDANRKGGDKWVAFSTEYGDSGTIYFSSIREKLADIETGFVNFEKAGKEAFGPNYPKFMADLNAMSESVSAEIRRRRWDLSVNVPADDQERMKTVATARWIRSIRIDLKPGRTPDFIDAWKPWQQELASLGPDISGWVSVTSTGTPALVLAAYFKDMAAMDSTDAMVSKALATQTYRDFLKNTADMIVKTSWEIHRFRPELSCVPDQLADLDPGFWRPKTPNVATRMKKDAVSQKKQ
jgi:hypothetical protein